MAFEVIFLLHNTHRLLNILFYIYIFTIKNKKPCVIKSLWEFTAFDIMIQVPKYKHDVGLISKYSILDPQD